jgi:hypothetical protein
MNIIKKELIIDHPSFEKISDFFNSYELNEKKFPVSTNETLFVDPSVNSGNNHIVTIEKSTLFNFKNDELNSYFHDSLNYIKSIYNIKILWLMIYPPKSRLFFHIDYEQNRHLLSFNENPRFFSYECDKIGIIDEINEKLKNCNDDIDSFNQYYLNLDPNCKIESLDKNTVYTFGDSVHNFVNDSDKLRVNFVFELMD